MRRKDKESIISLIIIIIIIFTNQGFKGVIEFVKSISMSVWAILKILNQFSVQYLGDTILITIFSSGITFILVGVVFEIFNIPKGKFGNFYGKISFWVIGFPISFILNIIGRLIFK